MINAINIPNEIISVNTSIISIGITSLLRDNLEEEKCAITPHVKLVYFFLFYHKRTYVPNGDKGLFFE
jgi:hypothetical protein